MKADPRQLQAAWDELRRALYLVLDADPDALGRVIEMAYEASLTKPPKPVRAA
jgi:hypothetical protein